MPYLFSCLVQLRSPSAPSSSIPICRPREPRIAALPLPGYPPSPRQLRPLQPAEDAPVPLPTVVAKVPLPDPPQAPAQSSIIGTPRRSLTNTVKHEELHTPSAKETAHANASAASTTKLASREARVSLNAPVAFGAVTHRCGRARSRPRDPIARDFLRLRVGRDRYGCGSAHNLRWAGYKMGRSPFLRGFPSRQVAKALQLGTYQICTIRLMR